MGTIASLMFGVRPPGKGNGFLAQQGRGLCSIPFAACRHCSLGLVFAKNYPCLSSTRWLHQVPACRAGSPRLLFIQSSVPFAEWHNFSRTGGACPYLANTSLMGRGRMLVQVSHFLGQLLGYTESTKEGNGTCSNLGWSKASAFKCIRSGLARNLVTPFQLCRGQVFCIVLLR